MPRQRPLGDNEPCIVAYCTEPCIGRRSEDLGVIATQPKRCVITRRTLRVYKRVIKPRYRRENKYCVIEDPVKAVLPGEACDLLERYLRGEVFSAVLLGPPGTGKSTFLDLVEKAAPVNTVRMNPESLLSKYVGEPEQKLRKILDDCEAREPCLLLVDEGDILIEKRSGGGGTESGYEKMEDNMKRELLRRMQNWYNKGKRIGILITSNRHINVLETGLLRAGRFGEPVYFPIPDTESLRILFRLYGKTVDDETLSTLIRRGATYSNVVEYIKTGRLQRFQVAPFAVLEYAPKLELGFTLEQKARVIIAESFPLSAKLAAVITSSIYDKPVLVLKEPGKVMDLFYLGESMKMPIAVPYSRYSDSVMELFYNYEYPVFFLGKYWEDIPFIVLSLEEIAKHVGEDELYRAICDKEPPSVYSGGLRAEITRCLSGFEYRGRPR